MTAGELARLRHSIDAVNLEILRLLERRASLVLDITRIKHLSGLALHDPPREQQMLAALARQSRGLFQRAEIESIFRPVFEASRALAARSGSPGARTTSS